MGSLYVLGSVVGVSSQAPFPTPHLELLLLSQQVVVLIALVQGDQHILQPVPHAQGELGQFCVQAGRDDWKPYMAVSAASDVYLQTIDTALPPQP